MALVKITFDGSSVSAKQDADINHHVAGLVPAGIIKGLGSEINYSASNNNITFNDGYVQIYGRRIYVETGTKVYVSLDSTKYGYVVITVDLSKNTAEIGVVETSSSSYPTLVQQNLCNGGTKYQMPIAKYSKTTTALNLDTSFARGYIQTTLSVAQKAYSDAVDYVEDNHSYYQLTGSGSGNEREFYLNDNRHNSKNDTMFFGKTNTGHIIMFPGAMISPLSNFSCSYCDSGTDYDVVIGYTSQHEIIITCNNTSHYVKYLYAVR